MIKLFVPFIAAIVLAGCSGSPGPGDTVTEMYKKICDAKSFKPMLDYAAPESAPLIGMAIQMSEDKDKGPKIKQDLMEKCAKGFKVQEQKVEGDNATVVVAGENEPTVLRRIEGKWKIVISKDSPRSSKGGAPSKQDPEACVKKEIAAAQKDNPGERIPGMVLDAIYEACGAKK